MSGVQSRWRTPLPVPPEEAFAWHERPGALRRLLPPWEPVRVLQSADSIATGAEVVLRMGVGPLGIRWRAEHTGYEPPHRFVDEARSGPFARWRHVHSFAPAPGGSALTDAVDWALPLHRIAAPLLRWWVSRRLDAMFSFRHRRTTADLERHRRWGSATPLRVAVSGASGLVGAQLVAFLRTGGHEVVRLVRPGAPQADDTVSWDPMDPAGALPELEGFDGVVHLAGAPIADGRWTPERKRAIRESRALGTRHLAQALARLREPPAVLVSASAIGIYGDRAEPVDEDSTHGEGFLADVCRDWEAAATPARDAGIRVVHPRIGVVLDPAGGALTRLLPVFRLGLGGPVGSGEQGMSWVALDDLLAMLLFALTNRDMAGPFNAVSPAPVSSRVFARTLGGVLGRPAFLPAPGFAIRAAFGEMGEQTVLSGAFVQPTRLRDQGFAWEQGELGDALRFVLGKAP